MTQREVYEWRRRIVADRIIADTEHFNMKVWGLRGGELEDKPVCGTVACLAGTAALVAEELRECRTVWRDFGPDIGAELRAVVPSGSLGLPVRIDVWAQEYLGLVEAGLFYATKLSPEQVAKALLEDEPYVEDAS